MDNWSRLFVCNDLDNGEIVAEATDDTFTVRNLASPNEIESVMIATQNTSETHDSNDESNNLFDIVENQNGTTDTVVDELIPVNIVQMLFKMVFQSKT